MVGSLFSIVLDKLLGFGVDFLLNSLLKCNSCGAKQTKSVTNFATSWHTCPNCGNTLDQFTNATPHTVNRNKSIVAAYASNLRWSSWGGIFETPFKPNYDLGVVNSKNQDILVRIILSKFQGSEFNRHEVVFHPQYEVTQWSNMWMSFPRSSFPKGNGTFACDLKVYNLWGDLLHKDRSLGDYKNS